MNAVLLPLASSPGADRIRVLQITLESLSRLRVWVDLGCGESEATATIALPAHIRHISVDVVDPISPPAGFVRDEIPHFIANNALGPDSVVSLLDVIEHFPRPDAIALLETLEREAGAVVIFTPDSFYPQNATTHPEFADKPYQWHQSGWTKEEFVARGYAVVKFPQLHMDFGGFAAVRVRDWPAADYLRWRIGVESLRVRPFLNPSTCIRAWKEHVRFRHGESWWYASLRRLRQRR